MEYWKDNGRNARRIQPFFDNDCSKVLAIMANMYKKIKA